MSDGLNQLIERLSKSALDNNDEILVDQFKVVRDYILSLKEIRIFIANSQNFGNQSSSVNILRNLIRIGSTANFVLALYAQNSTDYENLIGKIKVLIPQFKELGKTFTLTKDGPPIVAVTLEEPLKPGPFAITGGFDNLEDKELPWNELNVLNYVQLQPYAWHRGTNGVMQQQGNEPKWINLDKSYPQVLLSRRAFYLPDPTITPDDWEAIAGTDFKTKAAIVRYLIDQRDASKINLCPAYGFQTKGIVYSNLYNYVAGILQAQDDHWEASLPTVLISIPEVDSQAWTAFLGYIRNPKNTMVSPRTASPNFVSWHAEAKVNERVKDAGFPGFPASLDDVKEAVQELELKQVLVLYLGPIPAVLFNELYGKSSLPTLLEGQATVELLLNTGKPYLKISSNVDETAFGYPTLPLNSEASGELATNAQ
ncbi:MAG TPA: peptidoglycan-binding protein LysM, partial [Blastocatellia bacterium]